MIGKEIGAYRIIEMIGQSELGILYKGVRLKLDEEVAITAVSSELLQPPSMRELFIGEAKKQIGLCHPNVVNVLDYVEQGDDLFLVTEFIGGETLAGILKRLGTIPNAVEVCISILSAMHFMHSCDIIHGDLKPGNIIFEEDGYVRVMDFGIGKVAAERRRIKPNMKLGGPGYLSPEQITGEEATAPSDLYSVGIVLYQMVTGKLPFDRSSEVEIVKPNLGQEPMPPWEIDANISKGIGSIIIKAISKHKNDRYQTARQFADDLRAGFCTSERQAPLGAEDPAPAAQDGKLFSRYEGYLLAAARWIHQQGIHFVQLFRKKPLSVSCFSALIILIAGLLISQRHLRNLHTLNPSVGPIVSGPAPVQQPVAKSHPINGGGPSAELQTRKTSASSHKIKTTLVKKSLSERKKHKAAASVSHYQKRIARPRHPSSVVKNISREDKEHRNPRDPGAESTKAGKPTSGTLGAEKPTEGTVTETPEVRGVWTIIK